MELLENNNLSFNERQQHKNTPLKIAMLTFCAGENYKNYMQIGLDSRIKYCKKHNIDFIIDNETASYYDKTRTYGWNYILMCKEYLDKFDYIIRSDADVLIKNFDFDIRKYIIDNIQDHQHFIFTNTFNGLNVGNFIVRNSPLASELLDLIDKCTSYPNRDWYEQAAIIHLVQTNSEFRHASLIKENNRDFNSYSLSLIQKEGEIARNYCYQEGDFLIHYAGLSNELTCELMKIDSCTNEIEFDIVISVGIKDNDIINRQIEFTKTNIIGYRNIYLICNDSSILIDGCITIDETIFPFSIETVSKFHGQFDRNGWYLQQLLKLYAGKIIPGILERYLVIDADTIFLKPTVFIRNNRLLYNFSTEYHYPYFEHMLKLDKDLIKVDKDKSGICHHMIFETKYIDEIINKIENQHNDVFYNVFLNSVSPLHVEFSGASEYEIYFNYMLKNHQDKIEIRFLEWKNTNDLNLDLDLDLDYVSYHWYTR